MTKKTKRLLAAAVLLAVLVLAGAAVLHLRREVLGNITADIDEPQTPCSDVSFFGREGDRIKFSLKTNVKSGTVDFVLTDSDGNVVSELDRARELETFVNLSADDTYTLTAVYEDFTGTCSIVVSRKRF